MIVSPVVRTLISMTSPLTRSVVFETSIVNGSPAVWAELRPGSVTHTTAVSSSDVAAMAPGHRRGRLPGCGPSRIIGGLPGLRAGVARR
jgi:hypothetical protein